ncbi:hypothetical protein GYMLUDRAFT_53331 [Collybiopsis luxurians FD-317 M1]|nr:hypothetical protein GYMLUDRAFT_53331 [Collybiopsis luxurians FD-317 M1]
MTLGNMPKPPQLRGLYCNVTEDISDFIFSWMAFYKPIPIWVLAVGLFNTMSNAKVSQFLAQSGSTLEAIKIWDAYVATGFDLSPCTRIKMLRMGWIHLASLSPAGSETFMTDVLKTITSSFIKEVTVMLQILVSNTLGVEGDLGVFDWAGLMTVLQWPQFKNLQKFCFSVSSHAPVVKRGLLKPVQLAAALGKLTFDLEGAFQSVPWSHTKYGGQW